MNHVTEYQVAHCLDCGYEAKIIQKFQNIEKLFVDVVLFDPLKKAKEIINSLKPRIKLKSEIAPLSVSSQDNFCSRFE